MAFAVLFGIICIRKTQILGALQSEMHESEKTCNQKWHLPKEALTQAGIAYQPDPLMHLFFQSI